jgi:hypothetical protein
MRKNNNYLSDQEFEDFLKHIGGIKSAYRLDLEPSTERYSVGVGNGWLGIIQRLFETLIKLGWNREVLQIKEKFGGLRLYLNDVPENYYHFIEQAEKDSYEICEVCGEPGEQSKINGWIFALCEEHRDEKLYVDYEGKKYLKKLKEPVLKGDIYFNALTNKIEICDKDNFFDPWSLKVVEVLTIKEDNDVN